MIKKIWKKTLATCCASMMLVILPGEVVQAAELQVGDVIISNAEDPVVSPDDSDVSTENAMSLSEELSDDLPEDLVGAANQSAMWFMDDLRITQLPGEGTHYGTKNFDVIGVQNNNIKAPFDCSIVDIFTSYIEGNTVVIQSNSPVQYADGRIDYMSMAFAHDNDISDCYVGRVLTQGEVFYQTGTYGKVTGPHSHVTCMAGKYTDNARGFQKSGYTYNGSPTYSFANAITPTEALFISPFTNVVTSLGLVFNVISPTPVEYKAPDIKNAHITNATTASYEVRFNAYDDSGIVFAQVGCWSDKWDIDKAKWYTVPFSNNYGAITIPVSDMGGYKDCWYYCNIYVVDEFGNKSEATTVKVFIDGTAPQIKNAHTTNTTTTSYEVRFNAYDDSDITFAQVGCWSDKWDIDKAKWYTVPFSNNYGAITIPISDMGGYKDCWYYCNIYTLDAFGNRSNATTVKVYICDTNSTNHNWGDPIWKWTGNDANGYSAATATVTCKTDKSHKMTFKATVTKKASGTGKNAKMTYTATATISGKKFTTTKTVAIKMALVSSASVGKLKTIKLTPVLTPKDMPVEAYTWKSSKPAAATVNSSGTVTGANLGQTDITATCSKYGLSAKCTVNVWFNDVMPKDVPAGITKENYQYIYWGVKNGIINGYSDGSFKPNNPVTRAQFCIMIWKLAGKPAPSSKAASFKDISGLTANGQKAIKWAQEKGLVNGFGNGIFKPNDVLTRCQIMIILWKWSGRPAYGNMAKYSDISALTLNTQKAISWGVNNRIISASGNKFTPNGNVSRADFLNILYQFNKVSYKKIPSNLDAVPKQ